MKKLIPILMLALMLFPHLLNAAIARDNSTSTIILLTNNASFPYTVNSNSSGLLLAFEVLNDSGNPSSITGSTYGGVSMTRITSEFNQGIAGVINSFDIYCLVAPAAGSNTFTSTSVGATIRNIILVSYTGAQQTCTPDADGTGSPVNDTGSVTSFTKTIAPSASSVWGVMFAASSAGAVYTAGANTTIIKTDPNKFVLFDTNGANSGSFTMAASSASQRNSVSFFSIAPGAAVIPTIFNEDFILYQ